jgi:hypothetical protein
MVGEQHYHNLMEIFGDQHDLLSITDRDRVKQDACERIGITLVKGKQPSWVLI